MNDPFESSVSTVCPRRFQTKRAARHGARKGGGAREAATELAGDRW